MSLRVEIYNHSARAWNHFQVLERGDSGQFEKGDVVGHKENIRYQVSVDGIVSLRRTVVQKSLSERGRFRFPLVTMLRPGESTEVTPPHDGKSPILMLRFTHETEAKPEEKQKPQLSEMQA